MEIENLEKKNKTLKIILIIFIIIALIVGGYYIYVESSTKEQNINENNKDNKNNIDKEKDDEPIIPVIKEDISKEILDRINTIIEKELYVLDSLKKISELTPKLKAYLALDLYEKPADPGESIQTIKAIDLVNTFNKTSLSKYGFENTNIPCVLYEDLDHSAYTFKPETSTYEYTELGHGGGNFSYVIDKELVEQKKENNLYIISYKYLWGTYTDFDMPIKLFTSFEDANALINSIAEVEETANKDNLIETYAKDTNTFNSLDTYTYTFELINNELKLKEFSRN